MNALHRTFAGAGVAAALGVAALVMGGTPGIAQTPTREAQAQTQAVDISGPCDEAEHANDPRCTGASPVVGSGNDEVSMDSANDDGPNHDASDDSGHDASDDSGHDASDDSGHDASDDGSSHEDENEENESDDDDGGEH